MTGSLTVEGPLDRANRVDHSAAVALLAVDVGFLSGQSIRNDAVCPRGVRWPIMAIQLMKMHLFYSYHQGRLVPEPPGHIDLDVP